MPLPIAAPAVLVQRSAKWARNSGAIVHLERAPLKYEGLSYTEIWISEAQERMILAVSPDHWETLLALCASEDVEAVVIGSFEPTGRLQLFYQNEQVADLEMRFLHDGRPEVVRRATWAPAGRAFPDKINRRNRRTARRTCYGFWVRTTSAARNGLSASTITRCKAARRQAAGRASRRWPRRCGGGDAGAGLVDGVGGRLRHQPALWRTRPLSPWPPRLSMRRCVIRRGRGQSRADRVAGQFLLG